MTDTPTRLFPTFEAAGVRGSRTATDVQCSHYGGDTTCLLLTSGSGEQLLVDAGSGLFRLNPVFEKAPTIDIFISHAHLDHLQGVFFLNAFFKKGAKITLHCSATTQDALLKLFAPPFFPISLNKLPALLSWDIFPKDAEPHCFQTPAFCCQAIPIPHPGGAYALLVTDKPTGETILIANDVELDPDKPFDEQAGLKPLLQAVCSRPPINAVILDAMFDPKDMAAHKGWGHSDFKTAIAFGTYLKAQTLYLAHHHPTASDLVLSSRQVALKDPNVTFLRQQHILPWKVNP